MFTKSPVPRSMRKFRCFISLCRLAYSIPNLKLKSHRHQCRLERRPKLGKPRTRRLNYLWWCWASFLAGVVAEVDVQRLTECTGRDDVALQKAPNEYIWFVFWRTFCEFAMRAHQILAYSTKTRPKLKRSVSCDRLPNNGRIYKTLYRVRLIDFVRMALS